ncbi:MULTISPECIES: CopD family protein [Methylomicrobium]|uniref:Putative copper export protein n=1 Tax=Methylomicrobium album BG8 TaxID=686340 RepID=H8GGZ7_METAL|nr:MULTISPECIES: CopD family protein [Methylomicrobium]EIC31272.1 putative copper export protein [Methylomicrobium album BG8]
MNDYILLLHLLAATIWTGGHLVLAITILPRALKEKSPTDLLRFEAGYEKVGVPALAIQVVTGLLLAHNIMPDIAMWFSFDNPLSRLILLKLGLLLATLLFAIDARLRIIPNLTEENLMPLAYHIIPVTVISVLFVIVGVSFRTSGLL